MCVVDTIKTRWQQVQDRMAHAAIRSGRNHDDIRIMAVSKTVPLPQIIEAYEAGITLFGENRIQEAQKKFGTHRENLPTDAELHLVGHLQTNKARKALELFDMIHSVDSVNLAETLSRIAGESNRRIPILIEVNTSGEDSKFGVTPDQVLDFTRQAASFPNLHIQGFMTVGAWLPDAEQVRPCFRRLREIRDRVESMKIPNVNTNVLSMGMTNDFEVAIEEGATLVRIGTAIFGARPS
jgi:pyridoxal phosphate enzyme (YggS family)